MTTVLAPAARLGLRVPLTRESLTKLTTSFSLDVAALADTGFRWPNIMDIVLDEMVAASIHRA
jgi:hypothetical protein